jgi:hypothetical protein
MRNFASNFEEIIIHRGLYRVWVPLREGNRERLVSIWIDPAMRAFESPGESRTGDATREPTIAADGDTQTVEEAGGQCPRPKNVRQRQGGRFAAVVTIH